MTRQNLILLTIFFYLSQLCAGHAQIQPTVFPNENWQYFKNIPSGWDRAKLAELSAFISDSSQTTGMMIIYRGKVLFEYGDITENTYLASCRKSILAILYGPFVKSGKINLEKTMGQLGIDDIGGLLPVEKEATIRNLLTARSGIYHLASNEGDATAMAPKRGSVLPGSFWLYNNWDFNAAGYILEHRTGRTIYQLIDSILARPLEMQDWNPSIQRKTGDTSRSKYLAYHMWFSTRDMARIGYLMLNNGRWNGKQLIPADWIRQITSVTATYAEALKHKTNWFNFGYGYLWWVWDKPFDKGAYEGAYSATGAYGQFITVLPKLELVIAHKTNYERLHKNTPTETYLRILDKLIAAKIKSAE